MPKGQQSGPFRELDVPALLRSIVLPQMIAPTRRVTSINRFHHLSPALLNSAIHLGEFAGGTRERGSRPAPTDSRNSLMNVRGGSSGFSGVARFDLPKVDSGKSGETSGACLPTGRDRRMMGEEVEVTGGGRSEEDGRVTSLRSRVWRRATGVEMSDLSARARWRVSSPVDQSCCFYSCPTCTSAGLPDHQH